MNRENHNQKPQPQTQKTITMSKLSLIFLIILYIYIISKFEKNYNNYWWCNIYYHPIFLNKQISFLLGIFKPCM